MFKTFISIVLLLVLLSACGDNPGTASPAPAATTNPVYTTTATGTPPPTGTQAVPTLTPTLAPTLTPSTEPTATALPTKPSSTPVPSPATTPTPHTIIIQPADPFEGDLNVYKLVFDSSLSYTSIHYVMRSGPQSSDSTNKDTQTWTYTAIRPQPDNNTGLEVDVETTSNNSSRHVIIKGGQRFEKYGNTEWVAGNYSGAAEGDIAGWAKNYAEILGEPDSMIGFSFTLQPAETFNGVTVGHFTLIVTNGSKWEVRYDPQSYKPVQIDILFGESRISINYEYNNPAWEIKKPATWVEATPTLAPQATTAPGNK